MKQIAATLLTGAMFAASAFAQQPSTTGTDSAGRKATTGASEESLQSKMDSRLPQVKELFKALAQHRDTGPAVVVAEVIPVGFVVKDGAVYYVAPFSNILLPMPGGGASGCFSANLPTRIDLLRSVILELPPVAQSERNRR
jgi:hypothetical protein